MARDPLRTRLCEAYGCEYPIVAFSLTREVVAAATNAGAIGVYGASPLEPEQLRSDIRWIRDQVGERPFGIDTLLPASFEAGNPEDLEARIPAEHRGFVEELQREHGIPDPRSPGPWKAILGAELLTRVRRQVDVILDERVPIFASGLGSPMLLADRAREVGTSLWGLVGAPRQARREIEAGIDVVVAQGADSGGHSGRIGTFSLVPAVTRLASGSSTLVVAAGGVTTGQQLAAALALGADGVWCGTIWQTTEESDVDPALKQRLLDAQTEDAIKTRALTGKPAGVLRSKYTEAWEQEGAPEPLKMPLQGMLVAKLRLAIEEWALHDYMVVGAGSGVGLIERTRSTRQVIEDLASEARETLGRVSPTN